jgi:hypothetical protein
MQRENCKRAVRLDVPIQACEGAQAIADESHQSALAMGRENTLPCPVPITVSAFRAACVHALMLEFLRSYVDVGSRERLMRFPIGG